MAKGFVSISVGPGANPKATKAQGFASISIAPFIGNVSRTKLVFRERINAKVTDCAKVTIHALDGDKVAQKVSGGTSMLTALTQKPDGSLEATLSPAISFVTDWATEATCELTILRDGKTETKTVRTLIALD